MYIQYVFSDSSLVNFIDVDLFIQLFMVILNTKFMLLGIS